jgi:UDP-N-acetylmuramate--alanine ligase
MITQRFRGRHVHLIGMGGAGVSALAPLLKQVGATVSGCDAGINPAVERLRKQGFQVYHGHDPQHLDGVDVVVHTAAAKHDHPELVAARLRGIPIMTRGECLVELMAGTRTIAVAGSHGKTSTTWMLGHLLSEAGVDPVVMVGGAVASLDGGARVGASDWFVAETDESDGSFARIRPHIAIVTNIDHEHIGHYGSFSALENHFREWLETVPADGAVIIPTTGISAPILAHVRARIITCGLEQGDIHCTRLDLQADGSVAEISAFGKIIGTIEVPLPGAHMVHNALMALAAAWETKADIPLAALGRCERVRRRFTVHGRPNDIRVVEDYGHHPSEIRATIAAARLGGGRVHVLFQPHRYSRTQECFADFITAFDQAHRLALLPIYAAGETPIVGINSESLVAAITKHRAGLNADALCAATDAAEAIRFIAAEAKPGDTCLVLGAGNVGELARPLIDFFYTPGREMTVPEITVSEITVSEITAAETNRVGVCSL